jgi:predicted ATPase
MEQPEIRTETETRTCACGVAFEAQVSVFGKARLGPSRCIVCEEAEKERYRQAFAAEVGDPLARLAAAGVNVRKHGGLKLSDMGPAAELARKFVRQTVRAGPWDFVQGLYLAGPTGVGKTQLAVATMRELVEQDYRGRIVFDRARALITTIQDRYGSGNVDEAIATRRNAGLWVLDDIGTEKPTPDAFRILEDILDCREGHPTILTSNLEREALAQQWADKDGLGRFRSRIGPQNYEVVVLDGDDRRFAA